tara:strand:+ start:246 stop:665 length:420 start_codon:yes stop_codon:yes gene_type:complete
MITPNQIAREVGRLSKLDLFKTTRQREYIDARSLLNFILYKYKKMGFTKIKEFYGNNNWKINHATLIHSIKHFEIYKTYNNNLTVWLEHIVDNINKMDNFTKREYIKGKINHLSNKDIDEITMIVSNMPPQNIEHEKHL